MQAVPSLIGTGTAIAAAASGLVFAQPAEPDAPAAGTTTTTTTTTTSASTTTTTRRSTSRTSTSRTSTSRLSTSRISTTFSRSTSFTTARHPKPRRQISFDRDLPIGAHFGTLAASTADPVPLSGFAPHLPPACPESLPLHDDSSPPLPHDAALPPIPPPRHVKTSSSKGLRRKLSLARHRASAASKAVEGSSSTTSSGGSWIKRFTIRPSSDQASSSSSDSSSSSSSITIDAPSTKHSHSLSLPILSGPHSFSPSRLLPRNKLVKRTPSVTDQSTSSHSRSRSYLPHLRRPATSHQRSATIDHIRADVVDLAANLPSSLSPSFDYRQADRDKHLATDPKRDLTRQTSLRAPGWISFFHSRRLAFGRGGMTNRSSEARPLGRGAAGKRIALIGDEGRRKVHLVKPRMISMSSAPAVLTLRCSERAAAADPRKAQADEPEAESHLSGRSGRPRPSSMPFLPFPANEMPQSSNRLRRSKRTQSVDAAATEAERLALARALQHMSAPSGGLQVPVDHCSGSLALSAPMHHRIVIPSTTPSLSLSSSSSSSQAFHENAVGTRPSNPRLLAHRRSHSSPLFAFPRISTFHLDSPRISPFPSSPSSSSPSSPTAAIIAAVATAQIGRPHQPSGSSMSSGVMSHLGPSATRGDRSSTMSISASDTRGFIFGDDDEIDFKSDTMYDSLRTVASSCVRATETPLDSVYDESPPSTAGNGKTKRMSVQEILGRVWDDDDRIVEEDENEVTIIRATDDDKMPFPMHTTLTVPRLSPNSSRDNLSSAANDIGRFCLDDELDEDWGDGDVHPSPLSPPSKSSSLNSRGLGSQLRLALTDESSDELEIAGPPEVHRESRGGRRLSSLFDWIETPVLDKGDMDGPYPRSKSALGKQETDTRGGRTSLRKGPTPAHIRSQSVPITQDGDSNAKPSSAKYGTWGLGTRPVSEDWDEDFDFDGGDDENEGGGGGGGSGSDEPLGRSSSFLVPESIRASQPSVKAHSGQIRELSLLVNDLKRLCRHGRDMDMLKGPRRDLWEEAEGVIALASPDEEDDDDEESASRGSKPTDGESDAAETAVPCLGRFDGGALENRNLEPAMSKTAVVRERHSPKRRSVFSPDDDIFGSANWPLTDDNNDSSSGSGDAIAQPGRVGRPRTPVIQIDAMNDAAGATRSVMEAMSRSLPRHRSPGVRYDKKVHFDTNSLRVLVRRAGELRDSLSDLVRHAENLTHTPCKAPRHERHAESSPAFTKVFDDPNASPQPVLTRSGGPDSAGDAPPSPRKSSSSPMGTHLQPMIVK